MTPEATVRPGDPTPASILTTDSETLIGVLARARQLLDWEGESIVPGGPQEALIDYMAQNESAGNPLVLALLHVLRRLYGAGVARVRRQVERYADAVDKFVGIYGHGPVALARAPARINILGEHVDYVRYLPTEVLPFASREHDMLMVFRPNGDGRVRAQTTLAGAEPAEFDLVDGPDAHVGEPDGLENHWLDYLHRTGAPKRHWINYVKAGAYFCCAKYPDVTRGVDFLLDSTVPAAGGASSSSTVVVLAGAAVRIANGLPLAPEVLAADSSLAEWYIGTRGGTMDHAAMCLSSRQHALHINFDPPRTELVPLHRFRYRWITFFAHPADKGGDVLVEYNERSAVSRLLIPAMLEEMFEVDEELRARWTSSVVRLRKDPEDVTAAHEALEILKQLPEEITLDEVVARYPKIDEELTRSYPHLKQGAENRTLKVRNRAMHHAGEVVRVREVTRILKEIFAAGTPEEPEKTEPGLRAVGELITETHESMRDLYELCTDDINELTDILLGHPGVYGARLMGGGFGGNILGLVGKEHVAELVDQVQERYFAPRGRDGVAEGSVMVSTPGEGYGAICLADVLEHAVINASAVWWNWQRYAAVIEKCLCALLGCKTLAEFAPKRPVQPVIVAGGRDRDCGDDDYRSPSSLTRLNGNSALEHVLEKLGSLPFETLPPVIITSPGGKDDVEHSAGLPEGARIVVQRDPLGTGHAVWCALDEIRADDADVLVVWGSQPLLSTETLARSIIVHQAVRSSAMLFPTAVTRTPYAPIQRDLKGFVIASRETVSEGAPTKRLGETNVGAFVLGARSLHGALRRIHDALWDSEANHYTTASGTMGFPNEMARTLVGDGSVVIALPIAHVNESLGLRDRAGYEEVRRLLSC